jgi:hypothetical protein
MARAISDSERYCLPSQKEADVAYREAAIRDR